MDNPPPTDEIEFYSTEYIKVTNQRLVVPPHTWPVGIFRPVQVERHLGENVIQLTTHDGKRIHTLRSDNLQRLQLIAEAINQALTIAPPSRDVPVKTSLMSKGQRWLLLITTYYTAVIYLAFTIDTSGWTGMATSNLGWILAGFLLIGPFVLPLGLTYGVLNTVLSMGDAASSTLTDNMSTWMLALGWLVYLGLTSVFMTRKDQRTLKIVYLIFVITLIANIAGCQALQR